MLYFKYSLSQGLFLLEGNDAVPRDATGHRSLEARAFGVRARALLAERFPAEKVIVSNHQSPSFISVALWFLRCV